MGDMNENVESQFRRMWATRPVRLPRSQSPQSWLFGVCEGIAVRYQVSPLLVRIVVGLSVALGGLGLWFYLAALLVFPRYGVPLSPAEVLLKNERDPRYVHDRKVGVRTLIVGAVLLLAGGAGSGGLTVSGVLGGVVVTGVAWWLLHQRLEVPPAGLITPEEDAEATATPTYDGADLGSLTPADGFTTARATPPSWDPLGAAPFAWDLPEPPDPSSDHSDRTSPGATGGKRRRGAWRRLGGVLLGVLLAVVLAVVAAVALVAGGVLHSENDDSDTGHVRRFTESSVDIGALDRDRKIDATFSDIDVNLAGAAFPGASDPDAPSTVTLSVTGRFSAVRVNIPDSTRGPSYRVRVDCAGVTASDVDCSDADATVVPSVTEDSVSRTLVLRLDATASQIRVGRVGD